MKALSKTERQWIEDYCNGIIGEEDFGRFQDALEESAALREALRRYLALDAGLRRGSEGVEGIDGAGGWAGATAPIEARKIVAFPAMRAWTVLAALLALGLFVLWQTGLWVDDSDAGALAAEPSARGFGVLTGADGAVWRDSLSLEPGDLLPAGPIGLVSGIVQLELFSGVTLVVEGDAAFEFVSPMEMSVTQGKVRATVPELARGFRIRSNEGELVDLGTEFALHVSRNRSEVHVLDGAVEWHSAHGEEVRRMAEGQGLRILADGVDEPISADSDGFVGLQEMNRRLDSGLSHRFNQWLAVRQNLRRDPRVVAYYSMESEGPWQRQVPNLGNADIASAGVVVASRPSDDRFGRPRGALDFSQTGSRVRLRVDQELSSLTLMAWVKIDSLDRWYNSLLLTDGHELNEPHWQIMRDGRLFFSVKRRTADRDRNLLDKHVVYSQPFWTPAMSGKWLHIATTYDTSSFSVTHYVNGAPIHSEVLPENMRVERVEIGPATIGNWSEPTRHDPEFSVRNLNGSIDEFAIFSVALPSDEIAELYQQGKP